LRTHAYTAHALGELLGLDYHCV